MSVGIKWLIVLLIISAIGIIVVVKMKLPVWKFQVGWILFIDLLGVVLLGFCLNSALWVEILS